MLDILTAQEEANLPNHVGLYPKTAVHLIVFQEKARLGWH